MVILDYDFKYLKVRNKGNFVILKIILVKEWNFVLEIFKRIKEIKRKI